MKAPVFTGCATALVTPFRSGVIDYDALARLISRQTEGGVSALVISGTTGETATLSPAEKAELFRFAVKENAGHLRMIAGIGGNDTAKAAEAAKRAEHDGYDAVLLTTPYYNKANSEGLYRHFITVADNCGLPLIVYNVPSRTGVACSEELYARLAEHPRINGVKEASGDISLVSRTRSLCGDELYLWSGNDDQTLPMMSLGAKGVISVASHVIPEAMGKLCGHCLYGNFPAARLIHEKYAKLFSLLFIEVNPIPVKTALNMMGQIGEEMRLPLFPISAEHREALRQELKCLKLIEE